MNIQKSTGWDTKLNPRNHFIRIYTTTLLCIASHCLMADEPKVELGIPTLHGSGCPEGTAAAALSPDGKYLTIIFDRFLVEAGKDAGKAQGVGECHMKLPMNLADGYRLKVLNVQYRGFASLPKTARMILSSVHNVTGFDWQSHTRSGAHAPIKVNSELKGEREEDFFIEHRVRDQGVAKCKTDIEFEMHTVLKVENCTYQRGMIPRNPLPGLAMVSLDTADGSPVDSAIQYELALEKCRR